LLFLKTPRSAKNGAALALVIGGRALDGRVGVAGNYECVPEVIVDQQVGEALLLEDGGRTGGK
jgi:hypothetical protein